MNELPGANFHGKAALWCSNVTIPPPVHRFVLSHIQEKFNLFFLNSIFKLGIAKKETNYQEA